jgi:hypothetical protein
MLIAYLFALKKLSVIGSPVQHALAFYRDGPGSCPILGRTYKQCHGMFRLQETIQQF